MLVTVGIYDSTLTMKFVPALLEFSDVLGVSMGPLEDALALHFIIFPFSRELAFVRITVAY